MRALHVVILSITALIVANACRSATPPPVAAPTDGQVDAARLPGPVPDGSTGRDTDLVIDPTDACTLITARTADETSTTCATKGEADIMARFILQRRDGGMVPKPCTSFPTTTQPLVTLCASEDEVLRAIDFLSKERRTETQRHVPRKR